MANWEKKSFSSWVLVTHWAHLKKKKRKTEKNLFFIAENMLQGWRHNFAWVNGLSFLFGVSRFEPVNPGDTNTVAFHTSYPWISWKEPAESYRFLSVWGTSARCRTHGSWGVQLICRRPGRQILQEKGMHSTAAHPRALGSLAAAEHSQLSPLHLYLYISITKSDHPQENPVKVTRTKPNSSHLLGFLDITLPLRRNTAGVLFLCFLIS